MYKKIHVRINPPFTKLKFVRSYLYSLLHVDLIYMITSFFSLKCYEVMEEILIFKQSLMKYFQSKKSSVVYD